jgi:uncharacterized protein (TIGR03083 family)
MKEREMDTPAHLVTVFHAEAERLAQYLDTLPPDAWTQPSPCVGWEVRDVVAHLTFIAEFYADVIARGVQGDTALLPDRPPGDGPELAAFHAYLAERAIAWRERAGEHLLATFRTRYAQLHHLLAGLAPEDWEKPCAFWRFAGNIPVRMFLPLVIPELAIHGWDIRSRFETPSPLSAASVPVLMARIPGLLAFPGVGTFRLGARAPKPVRYRFALTGAVPGTYDMQVENDTARIAPVDTAPPHVTFRCATDIFVLLMYRRLTLEPIMQAGHLAVDGDPGLIAAFDRWLKRA